MNLWDKILASLEPKVNRQSFNTWLRPTQQLSLAQGSLQVEVPSLLFVDWIKRNYLPLIEESARALDCGELQVSFTSRQGAVAQRHTEPVLASGGHAPAA